MTKLENRLYQLIQAQHGISFRQASTALNVKISSLVKAYDTLNELGYVSYWYKKLYPNYRSIEVYEKGKDELHAEVILHHYLTPKRIGKFIKCADVITGTVMLILLISIAHHFS